MVKLNFYIVLIFVLSVISCGTEDNNAYNPLIDTGLVGNWEISGRGINNLSSLEALCCETLSFLDDDNERDLSGIYIFDEQGIITNGAFIVDLESNIIEYTTESSNTKTLEFNINNDVLEVWFYDGTNRHWTTYNK
ncbi:MAG: hypothetical protein CMC05_09665 [Flavobacteriaceae bacterium]|nr:hypothetical protein [Flavobacteriaceae bacterium]|tara:strand:- start:6552 stop:6959 length:408 start_codon:yes stop_codon:yes gene_type:complete